LNNIWWAVQIKKLLIMQFPPVTSSFLRPNIFPSTHSLVSSVCFPLSTQDIKDEAAHPFNRSSKIIVLYILIFIFVNNKWEDNTFWTILMTYISKGAGFGITDVICNMTVKQNIRIPLQTFYTHTTILYFSCGISNLGPA
jgi:hypothetical protein